MFKVIVAGGRDFEDWNHDNCKTLEKIDKILSNYAEDDIEMVTGKAAGADQIPYYYKIWHGYELSEFPALWSDITATPCVVKEKNGYKYNALAGHNRNEKMAVYADALIAFWDGKSTGTKDMIDRAKKHGLKVRVIRYDN